MVGRALERDVERNVDALVLRGLDEVAEVVERAQVGIDRLVPALLRPDRPWAPGLAGFGGTVVGALAVSLADGVDGWQIEHVEPHACDVREEALDVLELADRAWEELVPGAEAGPDRLDDHLELAPVDGGGAPVGVSTHQVAGLGDVAVERGRPGAAQRLPQPGEARGVGGVAVNPGARLLHPPRPDLELHRHVLPGLDALGELPAPCLEVVDPALDGEAVAAKLAHGELTLPAIVQQGRHRHLGPALRLRRLPLPRLPLRRLRRHLPMNGQDRALPMNGEDRALPM